MLIESRWPLLLFFIVLLPNRNLLSVVETQRKESGEREWTILPSQQSSCESILIKSSTTTNSTTTSEGVREGHEAAAALWGQVENFYIHGAEQ